MCPVRNSSVGVCILSDCIWLCVCVAQVSDLEVEVDTLTGQLQAPDVDEPDQNGAVTVDDLDHMQKVNKDLEQQLGEKNKVRGIRRGSQQTHLERNQWSDGLRSSDGADCTFILLLYRP